MSRKSGYSLFEVLIAFAIMAAVLAVILPGQARLFARVSGGTERHLAVDYALSRLDRLGVADPVAVGETRSVYRNWTVSETIQPAPDSANAPALQQVRVDVFDDDGRRLASAETVRAGP